MMNNPFNFIMPTVPTENSTTFDMVKTNFEINLLKKRIEATDYKVIKCHEYALCGLELPYDIESLHAERQALRDKINELQNSNGI